MSADNRNGLGDGGNGTEQADDKRKTRSIRFSESEWEEVRNAALAHDLPAAEFVRERILALVRDSESAGAPAVAPPLAPLIEAYVPLHLVPRDPSGATKMIREGRERKSSKSSSPRARTFQESLRPGRPGPERSAASRGAPSRPQAAILRELRASFRRNTPNTIRNPASCARVAPGAHTGP